MSDSPLQLTFGARQRAFLTSAADFHKQRTTVTRRIHTTRRHLRIQQKDTKKYTATALTKDDYESDYKYYTLGLMGVEKDFLYALELRAQSDASTTNHSKHKQLITRLKRALQRSQELNDAAVGEKEKIKRLELLVYSELIRAHHAVATKKWESAINAYSLARCCLQFLEHEGPLENKALYKDIIEENVDEALKLAIYRVTKDNSSDLTVFSKRVVETKHHHHEAYTIVSSFESGEQFLKSSDESELVTEIQWRSYSAKVNDETTSRLLSQVEKIDLDSLEAFDSKMALLQDGLENHEAYTARTVGDDDDQDDQIILAYVKYSLLLTRAQRDATLLEKANKKESLRIVETIKTTIKEVQELPGVYSDDELCANLKYVVSFFDSFKLRMLSDIFSQSRDYTKAFSLTTHALKGVEDIKLTVEFEGIVDEQKLQEAKTTLQESQRHLHILASLSQSSKGSVADNLSTFATSHHTIVDFELELVPSKPVLFDVAFNYVTYPTSTSKSRESTPSTNTRSTEESTTTKKKGIFGLFGG